MIVDLTLQEVSLIKMMAHSFIECNEDFLLSDKIDEDDRKQAEYELTYIRELVRKLEAN